MKFVYAVKIYSQMIGIDNILSFNQMSSKENQGTQVYQYFL